jgi:hypothetical protein
MSSTVVGGQVDDLVHVLEADGVVRDPDDGPVTSSVEHL